ncbi:MAG: hypothetical protein JWN61_1363 [Pseudonocardiales bacterium]|nr:hypothetical protein [Pseudonocardiales bacterium]
MEPDVAPAPAPAEDAAPAKNAPGAKAPVPAPRAAIAPGVPTPGISAPFGATRGGAAPAALSTATAAPGAARGRGGVPTGLAPSDRGRGEAAAAASGPAPAPAEGEEAEVSAEAKAPVATSKIPIPGITPEIEEEDPFASATIYENVAGQLLQTAQRHDAEIVQGRRFTMAHLAKIEEDILGFATTPMAGKAKFQKTLKDRWKIGPKDDAMPILSAKQAQAQRAMDEADRTQGIADAAVPLIDGTYEESRRIKVEVKKLTGGRTRTHASERFQAKSKKVEGLKKHSGRLAGSTTSTGMVRELGGHVREAKLSGDQLAVRLAQFKVFKTEMKEAGHAGVGDVKALGKLVGGKIVGAATGGIFRPEASTTDGGHSGAMTSGFIGTRLKNEFAVLAALRKSAAFGSATGFHAALQTFMLIVREIRDFVGGAAIWCALLALIPGAQAIFIPLGTLFGLMAIALSALRSVIGVIMLSWSSIQRATMSNWRAKNQVNAQVVQQGSELLGDAAGVIAPTGAAMAGTAAGGSFTTTVGQLGTQGYGNLTTGAGPADLGGMIAATAANKAVGIVGGAVAPGGIGAGIGYAKADADRRGATARNTRAPVAERGGPARTKAPAAPAAAAPGFIKDSQESFALSTKKIRDALIDRHAAKLSEFHTRTQALIGKGREATPILAKAEASKSTDVQTNENFEKVGEGKSVVGDMIEATTDIAGAAGRLDKTALLKELDPADA